MTIIHFLLEYCTQISLLLLYWLVLASTLSNLFTLKICGKRRFKYYGWACVISILSAIVSLVFIGMTCWEMVYNEPLDVSGFKWAIYHFIAGIAWLVTTCGLKDYVTRIELQVGDIESPD